MQFFLCEIFFYILCYGGGSAKVNLQCTGSGMPVCAANALGYSRLKKNKQWPGVIFCILPLNLWISTYIYQPY